MDIPELEPTQALALLEAGSGLFVDIRDGASYALAHVPGALHLGDHNIQDFLAATARDQPVVVYCYHGHMSLGGAAYLLENGFNQVWSLAGGFEEWRARHPTEPASGA